MQEHSNLVSLADLGRIRSRVHWKACEAQEYDVVWVSATCCLFVCLIFGLVRIAVFLVWLILVCSSTNVFDSFELIKLLESLNHVLVVINRNLIHERKEQIGRVFDFPTQPRLLLFDARIERYVNILLK
jgi:hypothetical protein